MLKSKQARTYFRNVSQQSGHAGITPSTLLSCTACLPSRQPLSLLASIKLAAYALTQKCVIFSQVTCVYLLCAGSFDFFEV